MEERDIDEYIERMEAVVKRKLELYRNLHDKIQTFKKHLKEEEEIHTKVLQNNTSKLYC